MKTRKGAAGEHIAEHVTLKSTVMACSAGSATQLSKLSRPALTLDLPLAAHEQRLALVDLRGRRERRRAVEWGGETGCNPSKQCPAHFKLTIPSR